LTSNGRAKETSKQIIKFSREAAGFSAADIEAIVLAYVSEHPGCSYSRLSCGVQEELCRGRARFTDKRPIMGAIKSLTLRYKIVEKPMESGGYILKRYYPVEEGSP
jgi:hypothetical protein